MVPVFQRLGVTLLIPFLLLQTAIASQQDGLGIRVLIVSGNATENVVNKAKADPLAIVVVDRYDLLIPGARVTFVAPQAGPGGEFANGSNTFDTVTDDSGRAQAPQYLPNSVAGPYVIQVEVEFAGETATAIVPQMNVRPSGSRTLLITVLSIVGAVGAGIAMRGGGGSDTPASTPAPVGPTIAFGNSSVSAPSP